MAEQALRAISGFDGTPDSICWQDMLTNGNPLGLVALELGTTPQRGHATIGDDILLNRPAQKPGRG